MEWSLSFWIYGATANDCVQSSSIPLAVNLFCFADKKKSFAAPLHCSIPPGYRYINYADILKYWVRLLFYCCSTIKTFELLNSILNMRIVRQTSIAWIGRVHYWQFFIFLIQLIESRSNVWKKWLCFSAGTYPFPHQSPYVIKSTNERKRSNKVRCFDTLRKIALLRN